MGANEWPRPVAAGAGFSLGGCAEKLAKRLPVFSGDIATAVDFRESKFAISNELVTGADAYTV